MFERFTDEARRALTVAQEEARGLDHDFIGTEHLLLGLLASAGGAAGDALTELGVTLAEARDKVEERVHPTRSAAQGTPPFTPLAKKALERSLRAALSLNDSFIGPEHVLLGLIDVPDGGGAQVLADLAGSLDHSREVVLAHVGRSPTPPPSPKREAGSRRSRLWITRGGSSGGGSATAPPVGEAPTCPTCHLSLAEHARFRVLAVPLSETEPPEAPAHAETSGPGVTVTVTVVYCSHCGTAVGVA